MTHLLCPVCRNPLEREGNSFKCDSRHSFDISRSGYVNLLPVSKMNSKSPGDSKEMVLSRRLFLEKGYYEPLRKALSQRAAELVKGPCVYFDAGCGTGYYTSAVLEALGEGSECMGIDISKFAADVASRREKRGTFAVASVYDLPIESFCVDIITNVFSPMADSEYLRILKKGGYLLYVVPGAKHLFSLKELLYDSPYENEESDVIYDGFVQDGCELVEFDMKLDSCVDVENLFAMTPYFWRTPAGALEKIRSINSLVTTAQFYIITLKKL